ncbi:hypothetical protein C8Q78DRAFT_1152489 [Trametes maxima]|nr:hypothetical protein C8Q78DRAFT_1152489 [Trametes maxima]
MRAQLPTGPKLAIHDIDASPDDGKILPPLGRIEGLNIVSYTLNGAGVSFVASAFGESDFPTQQDPAAVRRERALDVQVFELNTDLGGIGVDYEDIGTVSGSSSVGEAWLTTLTPEASAGLVHPQSRPHVLEYRYFQASRF